MLAVTSAVALGLKSASAADLGTPYKALPPVPMFSWTGGYVGVNGGGAWGQTDHTVSASIIGSPAVTTGNFDVDGGLAGGTVGYSYQIGQWVLGLESDLDWANIEGTNSTPIAVRGVAGNVAVTSRLQWLDTTRARLGWAFGHVMLYGTGGAAYGGLTATTTASGAGLGTAATATRADTQTRFGYAAGAGLEWAFTDNFTLKVEYLYVNLGSQNQELIDNVSFYTNVVRGGVNLKF
jgi:outer membrane immunogenic protein